MKTQKREKQEKHFLFHVGRGGQFHNAGHRSLIGEFDTYDDAVRYIYSRRTMFESNRDKKGRFCKKFFHDQSGHRVAEYGDMTFDFDGTYDMFQIVPTERLDRDDIALILIEGDSYLLKYLSDELMESIKDELMEAWSSLLTRERRKMSYDVIVRFQLPISAEIENTVDKFFYVGDKCFWFDIDLDGMEFESDEEAEDYIIERIGLPIHLLENEVMVRSMLSLYANRHIK